MLTKRQTLWAAPILVISFGVLCLIGYVSEEFILGKNAGVTAVVALALVANVFSLIFIFFSIFLSFGTALIFNASDPEWWERTGNPFYSLLWKELQEATTAGRRDGTGEHE